MNLNDLTIEKTWTFASKSNPSKTYETTLYTNGQTSCQCRGWTIKKAGQERTCTHTRKVEMGTADQEAVSTWTPDNQTATPAPQPTPAPAPKKKVKAQPVKKSKGIVRKIEW